MVLFGMKKNVWRQFTWAMRCFFTTLLASDMGDIHPIFQRHLLLLKGFIVLSSRKRYTRVFIHISILGEVDVKESWIKLFRVNPFGPLHLPCIRDLMGAGKRCEIFFRKIHFELGWFDLSTQKIEMLDFNKRQIVT